MVDFSLGRILSRYDHLQSWSLLLSCSYEGIDRLSLGRRLLMRRLCIALRAPDGFVLCLHLLSPGPAVLLGISRALSTDPCEPSAVWSPSCCPRELEDAPNDVAAGPELPVQDIRRLRSRYAKASRNFFMRFAEAFHRFEHVDIADNRE